jgi:hypothetical protein
LKKEREKKVSVVLLFKGSMGATGILRIPGPNGYSVF